MLKCIGTLIVSMPFYKFYDLILSFCFGHHTLHLWFRLLRLRGRFALHRHITFFLPLYRLYRHRCCRIPERREAACLHVSAERKFALRRISHDLIFLHFWSFSSARWTALKPLPSSRSRAVFPFLIFRHRAVSATSVRCSLGSRNTRCPLSL